MNTVVLFYRRSAALRKQNPTHPLNSWRVLVVDDMNSDRSNGKDFDLVLHYKNDPIWEVHTVNTTLPA